MRRCSGTMLALILLLVGAAGGRADEAADAVAAQKKAALANWALLDLGEPATAETTHLLIYAPASYDKRLKELGPVLEKHYTLAWKALEVEDKDKWWPGKLTVYLFAEHDHFTTFVRRVEKRRLEPDEVGSYQVDGDQAHAAAGPARTKPGPSVEVQAGQQVAAALLQKKAGVRVPLPDWLVWGFGRATYYRAVPTAPAVRAERTQAANFVAKNKRSAGDVWGSGLDADEAAVLSASLADFLAYGPGAGKFPAILAGFEPEENVERKTTAQALEAAKVSMDLLNKTWRGWVANPR